LEAKIRGKDKKLVTNQFRIVT